MKEVSAVSAKIQTSNVSHGEPLTLTTLSYLCIGLFVQSHTSLLTEQNDLAIFHYSTRKTCSDTCNGKRVGKPEQQTEFLKLNCFMLQISQDSPNLKRSYMFVRKLD